MHSTQTQKRLRDLMQLLEQTRELYSQLLDVVQAKIKAMKCADLHDMREQTQKEHTLAKRLHEREGLRGQLMELIGKEMNLSAHEARSITLSQLAQRLPQNQADQLHEISNRLRKTITQVAHVNRVAGVTTREVLNHLKWVLDSVKPKDDQPAGYNGDGSALTSNETKIFETVG